MLLTEAEARRAIETALSATGADAAVVRLRHDREATTRFANDAITQNVETSDQGLSIAVAYGVKVGRSSTNALDATSIREAVRRAEEIAKVSPPDAEYLPPVAPAGFPIHDPYFEETARLTPEARATHVAAVIAAARKASLTAAGVVESGEHAEATGNSAGLFVFERGTTAKFSATMTGADSTGWVSRTARNVADIDVATLAAKAIGRALASAKPKEWPAGRYATILEPAAIGAMVDLLGWGMSAREVDAGRSYLSGRADQALFAPLLVLRSDPFHPKLMGGRSFGEGFPLAKRDWIRGGKLQSLYYDRFTAKKHGVEPTPWPSDLILEGGKDSVETMIASIERGILVTHFWYIRAVDPMKPLVTGMTRDGLLAIEDGKVTGGLKNFRWNENPVDVLNAIEMMGAPEPADDTETSLCLVPPVKVREFNFSSATLF